MIAKVLCAIALVLSATLASSAFAAATVYNTRASFLTQLGASVTDDYANPGYAFINSNAAMSAVLGETDYVSTGFNNLNIVTGESYCAGCNGSFRLEFTSTSVGGANGVFGVGMDVFANSGYHAFVTYGDDSTEDILITTPGNGFFGVTAAEDIKSIHFGLAGGGTTIDGYYQIDNLTIGAQLLPEPTPLMLAGLAFMGLAATRRRRAR